MVAVGFGPDEIAIGGAAPKISAAGMEKGASEGAEGPDELAGIVALESGAGKFQEKLLESLLKLRCVPGLRISGLGWQCAPSA